MMDLEPEVVRAMAKAAGINLEEPYLSEVTHNLNALLEGMAAIDVSGLDAVEPLPVELDAEP